MTAAVTAPRALYIKLGEGGSWAADCLRNGTVRFGYREIPHDACLAGDWDAAYRAALTISKDRGAATRHLNQVKEFYGADEDVLWITFHADRLWWCRSRRDVSRIENGDKRRPVIDRWHDCDLHGAPLLKNRLSGKLLATQGFQGTLCTIEELGYLLHKINGTVEPHVARAQDAFANLQAALEPIIRNLHEKDFEILVDLIFRQAGWQRVGVSGGTERDIDLDLMSPVTGEHIAVQVKSRATPAVWRDYRERFIDMRGYTRFYFVTHSPSEALLRLVAETDDASYRFWDVREIAAQAARLGLTGWLLEKAA